MAKTVQLLLLSGTLAACGGDPIKPPHIGGASGGSAAAAGTSTGTGGGVAADATRAGTLPAGPVDPLTGCGQDPTHPSTVFLNDTYTSLAVAGTGTRKILGLPINFQETITTALALSASLDSASETHTPTFTAASSGAQSAADQAAQAAVTKLATTFMPLDERLTMQGNVGAWDGIHCTAQPAASLTGTTAAGAVTVTFDPPLPAAVSPLSDVSVYQTELASPHQVGGIDAVITASTVAGLAAGTKLSVTATLAETDPTYTATSGTASLPVGGDYGISLKVDLGNPALAAALGLAAETRYFVDAKNHVFKAIVAMPVDTTAPTQVYIKKQ